MVRWGHFYGAENMSLKDEILKRLNDTPEAASSFRGSLLFSVEATEGETAS